MVSCAWFVLLIAGVCARSPIRKVFSKNVKCRNNAKMFKIKIQNGRQQISREIFIQNL